ncbi:MAG: hypothetical protein IT368_13705 [Candidatus Hydrogenedentes bacterium]|nr:hypothetical protein [Candidatus Hydrogenedentota bacterium]
MNNEYYTLMGLPPAQGSAFIILLESRPFWIAGGCAFAAYAGFILWLRRYFNGASRDISTPAPLE